MTGRAEVERQKQRLNATFKRASGIGGDAELLSDFARYLSILVAGFLEQAVIELLTEHVRNHSQASVLRHLAGRLRLWTSANVQRLIDLLSGFDPEWGRDLEGYLIDERKDAVNSVVALRHTFSHGQFAGVTLARVQSYYDRVKEVVDHIADLCVPM